MCVSNSTCRHHARCFGTRPVLKTVPAEVLTTARACRACAACARSFAASMGRAKLMCASLATSHMSRQHSQNKPTCMTVQALCFS